MTAKTPAIRPAAVAGLFYPQDPAALRNEVNHLLEEIHSEHPIPKAIIAPHAGYVYSGPVAASAYATILPQRNVISRVILLGPAHRVYVNGLAASSQQAFVSPLGEVPLDTSAIAKLVERFEFVHYNDTAHEAEHSLEVQLPFLQQVLASFSLIPLAVGEASDTQIEAVLDELWGGKETLIVISSDLSHYHDYTTAQQMDRATSTAIENLAEDEIRADQACGRIPIGGLLRAVKTRQLCAVTADLRNSGDTAGPRDRVVGYGAYLFFDHHA